MTTILGFISFSSVVPARLGLFATGILPEFDRFILFSLVDPVSLEPGFETPETPETPLNLIILLVDSREDISDFLLDAYLEKCCDSFSLSTAMQPDKRPADVCARTTYVGSLIASASAYSSVTTVPEASSSLTLFDMRAFSLSRRDFSRVGNSSSVQSSFSSERLSLRFGRLDAASMKLVTSSVLDPKSLTSMPE